jgi:hypothetical protein
MAFKKESALACWFVDKSDPVEGENVMKEREGGLRGTLPLAFRAGTSDLLYQDERWDHSHTHWSTLA